MYRRLLLKCRVVMILLKQRGILQPPGVDVTHSSLCFRPMSRHHCRMLAGSGWLPEKGGEIRNRPHTSVGRVAMLWMHALPMESEQPQTMYTPKAPQTMPLDDQTHPMHNCSYTWC